MTLTRCARISIPRFARVAGGEFTMGADDGDEDERPAHRVHVDPFFVAIHAVTVDQYAEFVREIGLRARPRFASCRSWSTPPTARPPSASSRRRTPGTAANRIPIGAAIR